MALKKYQKLCSKKKNKFEKDQEHELNRLLAEDHTEFWKKWKTFGDTYPTKDLPNVDGRKWENYFRRLYDSGSPTPPDSPTDQPVRDTSKLNAPFTLKELKEIVKKLKNRKAVGIDRISAEFLKASPDRILKLLVQLLNNIMLAGVVPKDWCLGIITLLHKEGDKENPDNYRGICISSALMKAFSTMLNSRLNAFVEEYNIMDKAQIGFQNSNRTSDHLLTVRSVVNKYVVDDTKRIYSCFIDFRKAFDTVWHDGLFHKLQQLGIRGRFLNTIRYIYGNTKCAIKLGDKLTQFFPCKQGVRQGDPLSPTLFNLFLNDLFERLREGDCSPVSLNGQDSINALAYADDIVLLPPRRDCRMLWAWWRNSARSGC